VNNQGTSVGHPQLVVPRAHTPRRPTPTRLSVQIGRTARQSQIPSPIYLGVEFMERMILLTISSFCRQSEMSILLLSANFRSSPTCRRHGPVSPPRSRVTSRTHARSAWTRPSPFPLSSLPHLRKIPHPPCPLRTLNTHRAIPQSPDEVSFHMVVDTASSPSAPPPSCSSSCSRPPPRAITCTPARA
jgi:hypothetical protein